MTDISDTNPLNSVKIPALPYVIKANLKEYRRRLGAWRIGVALGITVFFYFRFGLSVWLISVVAIAILIAVILWFFAHRSITINPEGIEYKNAIGRRRSILFSDIIDVKVFLKFYEPNFGTLPKVTIAVTSGEPLSLLSLYWPTDQLDILSAVFADKKVKTEYYDNPATSAMIIQDFPAHATYLERHPIKIALIITPILLVVVAAIALFITFNQ